MAEAIIGTVASGITFGALAAQLAKSIIKLKSYWDQIEEAPRDIKDLIDEIEDITLILTDIEDDQSRHPVSNLILDNTSASRCLERCKKAVDGLKELIDDVATDIDSSSTIRRKWSSAKVVFSQKRKIEKFKARKNNAVQQLFLSLQHYDRVVARLQPDIIIARILQIESSLQAKVSVESSNSLIISKDAAVGYSNMLGMLARLALLDQSRFEPSLGGYLFGSASYSKGVTRPLPRAVSQNSITRRAEILSQATLRIRSPAWLLNQAWEFEFFRSFSGLTFQFRQFNQVPRDSLVFKYAEENNIRGLQQLFETGQASPYDKDPRGFTPLHVRFRAAIYQGTNLNKKSATYGNIAASEFLIEQGSSVNEPNQIGVLPLDLLAVNACHYETQFAIDFARILMPEAEIFSTSLLLFRGKMEVFNFLLSQLEPDYYAQPIHIRAGSAMGQAMFKPMSAAVFKALLRQGGLDPETAKWDSKPGGVGGGVSVLHCVTSCIGRELASCLDTLSANEYDMRQAAPLEYLTNWRHLFVELLNLGADPSATTTHPDQQRTLIGYAFFKNMTPKCHRHLLGMATELLRGLAKDLIFVKIDLVAYGRREKELQNKGLAVQNFELQYCSPHFAPDMVAHWRLISFSFGPDPMDWQVWGSEPTDEYAGEFWEMIEMEKGKVVSMPGSWIEVDGDTT